MKIDTTIADPHRSTSWLTCSEPSAQMHMRPQPPGRDRRF